MTDIPTYWGNQGYPADLWGAAPVRGNAVRVLHEFLESLPGVERDPGDLATLCVEQLIIAGVLPDERPKREA